MGVGVGGCVEGGRGVRSGDGEGGRLGSRGVLGKEMR